MWVELWYKLYSPGWSQTCDDPPTSASSCRAYPCVPPQPSKSKYIFFWFNSTLLNPFPVPLPCSYNSLPRMDWSLNLTFQFSLWVPDGTRSPTQIWNNFFRANTAWLRPRNQYRLALFSGYIVESRVKFYSHKVKGSHWCVYQITWCRPQIVRAQKLLL